jgi:hypothetical protein
LGGAARNDGFGEILTFSQISLFHTLQIIKEPEMISERNLQEVHVTPC